LTENVGKNLQFKLVTVNRLFFHARAS